MDRQTCRFMALNPPSRPSINQEDNTVSRSSMSSGDAGLCSSNQICMASTNSTFADGYY